jgi:hypothetical protein
VKYIFVVGGTFRQTEAGATGHAADWQYLATLRIPEETTVLIQ